MIQKRPWDLLQTLVLPYQSSFKHLRQQRDSRDSDRGRGGVGWLWSSAQYTFRKFSDTRRGLGGGGGARGMGGTGSERVVPNSGQLYVIKDVSRISGLADQTRVKHAAHRGVDIWESNKMLINGVI